MILTRLFLFIKRVISKFQKGEIKMPKTVQEKKEIFEKIQISSTNLSNEDCSSREYNTYLINEICQKHDKDEKNVLQILYKINTIFINENALSPFDPFIILVNKKPICKTELLNESELDFLVEVFDIIKNKMLKARIGDILWYLKYKKNIKYPEFLISIYSNLNLTNDDEFFDHIKLVRRGIYVTKQLGRDLTGIESNLYSFFITFVYDGSSKLLFISDVLRNFGLANNNADTIIDKLVVFGNNLINDENYNLAEQYFDEASKWTENEDKKIELQVMRVRTLISLALKKESEGILAGVLYNKAIIILRKLKKETRLRFFTESEYENLIQKKQASGIVAVQNMKPFSMPVDIIVPLLTQIRDNTTNALRGQSKEEMLKRFLLTEHIKAATFEQKAIEMNNSAFMFISNMNIYGSDGRVIGSLTRTEEQNPTSSNKNIFDMMVYHYTNYINMIVPARIMTGLSLLNESFYFCESEIETIVRGSHVVDEDRIKSFTKGIFAGFHSDYLTALNVLSPQFENLVRTLLKANGIITVNIEDGKEQEIGLSNLMEKDGVMDIFGEDLTFEIKALMCNHIGPNLRNNTAHGLLNDNEMNSLFSLYFWWFCLKFLYSQYISYQ